MWNEPLGHLIYKKMASKRRKPENIGNYVIFQNHKYGGKIKKERKKKDKVKLEYRKLKDRILKFCGFSIK